MTEHKGRWHGQVAVLLVAVLLALGAAPARGESQASYSAVKGRPWSKNLA